MNKFFAAFFAALLLAACAGGAPSNAPSWYFSPKQNTSSNLYGVAEGYTLEEATKYALADAAARLMVSISGESTLIREEDNNGSNEEMRQKVRQNIEKISFSNFTVSRSQQVEKQLYVEVQIEREPFIREQKERVDFLNKKISNLEKDTNSSNPIQRRNALVKILDLGKELELRSRILAGANEGGNVSEVLSRLANFESQLNKISDKIEFFFEINSPKEIAQTIRSRLNKEQLKIASTRSSSQNQIVIRIKSSSRSSRIYEAFMTKLEIDFENLSDGKILASNSVEVTGSSTISERESYLAAVKSFDEEIEKRGILKIIGITN